MSKSINIKIEIMNLMHQHAVDDFPNECVGFFYGRTQGEMKEVLEYSSLKNSKDGDQRRRFEVSLLDYMKAEKYALDSRMNLLGIFHSHPLHPAIPSEHDLKQAVPVFSYIITSVSENKIESTTSWQLNESNKFEEELLTNN